MENKAEYIASLLRDMAKIAKYDYAILEDAAVLIESQKAELDRLNRAIDNCAGGSLTSCCCNFNDA